jgi:hypothetical protein
MKTLTLLAALALSVSGGATFAQSSGANIRIKPGYFCAQNKCVRFSSDLQSVSMQSRRPVSVASYRLRENPVVSSETYRKIFYLALRQNSVGSDR